MSNHEIKFDVLERTVPDHTIQKWQKVVDTLANIFRAPAGLVMRVHEHNIEVYVSSHTEGNPYTPGASEGLHGKLYCETVMSENRLLYVDNALKYDEWKYNPDVPLNMTSYLGIPIHWPSGETFGTICVLDSKPLYIKNDPDCYEDLLRSFGRIVEDELELLVEIEKRKQVEKELEKVNNTLEQQVDDRTRQLNNSIERLKLATHAGTIGVWEWDVVNNQLIWDESMYRLYGIHKEDFSNASEAWSYIVHPDDKARIEEEVQAETNIAKAEKIEFRILRTDGSIRHIKATWSTFRDKNHRPLRIIGTNVDITDHKHNEDRLKENETKLRALFDEAGYAIGVNKSGMTHMVNLAYLDLFGYDDASELIGQPIMNQIAPSEQDKIRKIAKDRSEGKPVPVLYETKGLKKDGTVFDMDVRISTYSHKGETYGVAIIRDITERKLAEEKIKENLREKEILLRELYHRTKNNMQVISAMLRLKSHSIQNKELDSAFKDIENKILSMALVHSKLYKSKDLSQIDLKDYITSLISLIKTSYVDAISNITIQTRMKQTNALIDTAIPIGLIVNELLTNSIKHAFPDNKRGKIHVNLYETPEKIFVLKISDNGIGLPKNFDIDKDMHLGLQCVHDLVAFQLAGEIEITNRNGLNYQITFSKELYKPRV